MPTWPLRPTAWEARTPWACLLSQLFSPHILLYLLCSSHTGLLLVLASGPPLLAWPVVPCIGVPGRGWWWLKSNALSTSQAYPAHDCVTQDAFSSCPKSLLRPGRPCSFLNIEKFLLALSSAWNIFFALSLPPASSECHLAHAFLSVKSQFRYQFLRKDFHECEGKIRPICPYPTTLCLPF